jgi:hypothetical protein
VCWCDCLLAEAAAACATSNKTGTDQFVSCSKSSHTNALAHRDGDASICELDTDAGQIPHDHIGAEKFVWIMASSHGQNVRLRGTASSVALPRGEIVSCAAPPAGDCCAEVSGSA